MKKDIDLPRIAAGITIFSEISGSQFINLAVYNCFWHAEMIHCNMPFISKETS